MDAIETQLAELKSQIDALKAGAPENKLAMVVFSGDMDKVLAAFVIATGAVAMGMDVVMFFTFWGTPVLRDKNKSVGGKDMMGQMFGAMLPKGPDQVKLSKMNMGGMGTAMMKYVMRSKRVDSLPALIAQARAYGVRLVACSMSMDVMGITAAELFDGVEIGGVAMYLGAAETSNVNLFV